MGNLLLTLHIKPEINAAINACGYHYVKIFQILGLDVFTVFVCLFCKNGLSTIFDCFAVFAKPKTKHVYTYSRIEQIILSH